MKKGIILFICMAIGWTFHLVPVMATDAAYDEFNGARSYDNAVKDNAADDARRAYDNNNDSSNNNILGIPNNELRQGNVDMNTVAIAIVGMVEVVIGIAGTIAVFSLIYHAIQMQINSGITGDSSGVDKAKKGMIDAGIGFVIAVSAWFIVTRAIDLLGFVT